MSSGIPFGFGDIAAAIDPRRRQPIPFGNPDVVLPSELPGVEVPTRGADAPPAQVPAPSAGIATSFLGAPDIAWPGAQAPAAVEPAPAREPEATASTTPKRVRLPTITAPAPTSAPPAPTSASPLPITPTASPTVTPAPTAAASEDDGSGPSFANFRKNGGMDLLGSIGIGLLGSPTMAGGLSAGLQLAQRNESTRAATDLAKVELGLKRRKLAAEEAATGGNASILQRAYPWMSPAQAVAGASNSTLVTDALKIIRDPNSGRRMEQDGSNVRRWVDNGQPVFEGDTGKSFEMVPEDERVRLGLPAGSYQRESNNKVSPVNPTGTTINMGAEKAQDAEIGKEYGKQYIGYQTAGRNAGAKLNSLALMEQAMKMPGFYSGAGGDAVRRANQFLGALGVKDPKAASGAEVFGALSNQVVLDQLGGSLGPGVSNTDRDYIGRVAPGLEKTPEGNRQIIGIYRNLAKREQIVAQMARNYATKNGGRLDAGFDQEMAAFAEANPLFPQAKDGATANPPQDRRAVGGKTYLRGPDGWYEE